MKSTNDNLRKEICDVVGVSRDGNSGAFTKLELLIILSYITIQKGERGTCGKGATVSKRIRSSRR